MTHSAHFYNEVYYALFASLFLMLVASVAPFYRKDAIQRPSLLLMGIPLMGALSGLCFLVAPHWHRSWVSLANVLFVASMLGVALLLRIWQKRPYQKPMQALVVCMVVTGLVFEYWRIHGSFQQRNVLVVTWLIGAGLWAAVEAYRLNKIRASFFLKALVAALLVWTCIAAWRVTLVLLSETSAISLYEEPFKMMVIRFMASVLHLFMSVFLIAHAGERLHWFSLALRDEKDQAHLLNAQLAKLVSERDHMLMINSRFSTVSSLAMFNSAIVHELSQPLTALSLSLQEAQWHTEGQNDLIEGALRNSQTLVGKISQMNQSLRNLMLAQKPDLEMLDVDACIDEISPILRNEAQRRGVELLAPQAEVLPQLSWVVSAHKVMLERILFNLVANALDALAAKNAGLEQASIQLNMFHAERLEKPHVVIVVTDNGTGFSERMLERTWGPFESTKTSGMGVGLILARYILTTWNGELVLHNLPSGGASAALWIPLHAP